MKEKIDRRRMMWGGISLIGALACASMRNNPVWGMSPIAVGIIEGLVIACILMTVKLSYWHVGILIGTIIPFYWWMLYFVDGFIVPVLIAVNLMLIWMMHLILKNGFNFWWSVPMMTAAAFGVMLLGGAIAIWIVKKEAFVRSLTVSWNTHFYLCLSILGASALCVPFKRIH